MKGLVIIHIGAGYHPPKHEKEFKKIISDACEVALSCLREGKGSLEACAAAIVSLEVPIV